MAATLPSHIDLNSSDVVHAAMKGVVNAGKIGPPGGEEDFALTKLAENKLFKIGAVRIRNHISLPPEHAISGLRYWGTTF